MPTTQLEAGENHRTDHFPKRRPSMTTRPNAGVTFNV
jgi:hypothetical protein